jgi:hypothetical protein
MAWRQRRVTLTAPANETPAAAASGHRLVRRLDAFCLSLSAAIWNHDKIRRSCAALSLGAVAFALPFATLPLPHLLLLPSFCVLVPVLVFVCALLLLGATAKVSDFDSILVVASLHPSIPQTLVQVALFPALSEIANSQSIQYRSELPPPLFDPSPPRLPFIIPRLSACLHNIASHVAASGRYSATGAPACEV